MRITRYILMAAMSASVLLSCTKVEEGNTSGASENPQERIITISYAGTRTSLNEEDFSVDFEADDEILVAQKDGQAPAQSCIVKVIGGSASFTTTLQGELIAVYPASAAKVSGNTINENDSFAVPAFQSGRFKDADICTATISAAGTSAVFTTQVSILRFYVDESIGVSKIEIEGTGVASDGDKITIEAASGKTLYDVGGSADKRICYAAVCPVSGKDITLTGTAANSQVQTREIGSVSLSGGYIYNAFIPYYIDLGDAGKWGYCNIGAFLPEETGDYFMWGEVNGHKRSSSIFGAFSGDFKMFDYSDKNRYTSSNDSNAGDPKFDNDYFAPYYDGQDYSGGRYNFSDGLTTLALVDDAANFNWKGGWRMPTYDEFLALISEVNYDCGDGTENLPFIIEMNSNSLFLPYSGFGSETNLIYSDTDYWTSSLISSDDDEDKEGPMHAYCLCFDQEEAYMTWYYRSSGYCIRPIYDVSSLTGDIDTITGTLDPMGKVYF